MRLSLFNDLKQILWALLLVYIFLVVTGYLFGRQVGFKDAFLVCLGIAILVTVTFAGIFLCSVVWLLHEQKTREQTHNRTAMPKQ